MLYKECDKSQLIFPFFIFFSKWNRCQVLVVPLSAHFLRCSFHACCHCVLIFGVFFPPSVTFFLLVSPTPSSFLFLTYALCCVTDCTKPMSEICSLITAFISHTGQRWKLCGFFLLSVRRGLKHKPFSNTNSPGLVIQPILSLLNPPKFWFLKALLKVSHGVSGFPSCIQQCPELEGSSSVFSQSFFTVIKDISCRTRNQRQIFFALNAELSFPSLSPLLPRFIK